MMTEERTEIKEEVKTEQVEQKTEEVVEKCTKRACRVKEKELSEEITRLKDKNKRFIDFFSKDSDRNLSFCFQTIKLMKDHWGKEFINTLLTAYKKEEELVDKYEVIKDENGQELKCSFCDQKLKGWEAIGMGRAFFLASNQKYYCPSCYESRFPSEMQEKYRKAGEIRKKFIQQKEEETKGKVKEESKQ